MYLCISKCDQKKYASFSIFTSTLHIFSAHLIYTAYLFWSFRFVSLVNSRVVYVACLLWSTSHFFSDFAVFSDLHCASLLMSLLIYNACLCFWYTLHVSYGLRCMSLPMYVACLCEPSSLSRSTLHISCEFSSNLPCIFLLLLYIACLFFWSTLHVAWDLHGISLPMYVASCLFESSSLLRSTLHVSCEVFSDLRCKSLLLIYIACFLWSTLNVFSYLCYISLLIQQSLLIYIAHFLWFLFWSTMHVSPSDVHCISLVMSLLIYVACMSHLIYIAYIYIYMCVYTYVCTYIYICIYIHKYYRMHVSSDLHLVCIYIYMCIHLFMYIYLHLYM